MATFAVYIEKEIDYFGGSQRMGNTYHFQTQTLEAFNDATLAEYLAAEEKKVSSPAVRFVGWRTWGPTDGPVIDSIIRDEGPLSGVGTGNSATGIYAEACSLVVFPLPRSPVLNRRRFLRKFLRHSFGIGALTNEIAQGADPLPAGNIASLLSYANNVATPPTLGTGRSLSNSLGVVTNGPPEVRPYLYTRQIGQ